MVSSYHKNHLKEIISSSFMKKKIIAAVFVLLITISIVLVSASESNNCRKECTINQKLGNDNCSSNYKSCKDDCAKDRACIRLCSDEKKSCTKEVSSDFKDCSIKCKYIGKNITCLSGKYNAGEVFLEGCQICECQYNSRVSCKKTDFCNFNEVLSDQNKCESNSGLFQPLCNGPYFDIVCSQANFCLCDGNNNYTCPENYYCLHDFSLSLTRRGYTISGWKTLLGFNIGNIGVCVKQPVLDNCGNGICENIVISEKEAETILNCPTDCK